MMSNKNETQIRQLFMDVSAFEGLFEVMDRLHDAASAGMLPDVTDLDPAEVIGWLQDLVFTANETIREIESPTPEDSAEAYLSGLESVVTQGGLNA